MHFLEKKRTQTRRETRGKGRTMDRTRRAGSGLSGKKKIVLVVCLIVVALLVGYGILCGAAGRDVIYPNVTWAA